MCGRTTAYRRARTDYGEREKSIEEKIADVERQLERGEAIIVFDADTATTNIVAAGVAIAIDLHG